VQRLKNDQDYVCLGTEIEPVFESRMPIGFWEWMFWTSTIVRIQYIQRVCIVLAGWLEVQ
jgi:hypothetical protein